MNMKTCGIITEYNPFHQGHIYHIKKTKELTQCNCLIAIVSNHFTQRGLPSLLSMEDKTKLALEAGCNLVIELPACYAAQSADYFAKYAIESLHALNIDQICFGSETNDIVLLREYAKQMESTKVDPSLSMNRNLYSKDIQPNDILTFNISNNVTSIIFFHNPFLERILSKVPHKHVKNTLKALLNLRMPTSIPIKLGTLTIHILENS